MKNRPKPRRPKGELIGTVFLPYHDYRIERLADGTIVLSARALRGTLVAQVAVHSKQGKGELVIYSLWEPLLNGNLDRVLYDLAHAADGTWHAINRRPAAMVPEAV